MLPRVPVIAFEHAQSGGPAQDGKFSIRVAPAP